MKDAIYFKWLHVKNKFRNPNNVLVIDQIEEIPKFDIKKINEYFEILDKKQISYTYPGHCYYPENFYKMKEPPLFLEYIGEPCWMNYSLLSLVGSRDCHGLSQQWLRDELTLFLKNNVAATVSGGAQGVDQVVHLTTLKSDRPTIVVLPCGLENLYPSDLSILKNSVVESGGCFISEFEYSQKMLKHLFFHRNRLISAFSPLTVVVQAQIKSGTMHTVHHSLENGRLVATLPGHPKDLKLSGNNLLIKEGAFLISDAQDLESIWKVESSFLVL